MTQADARFDIDVAEMIGRQRNLVTDDLAHLPDVFDEDVDAVLGELNAAERVHDILPLQRAGRGRNGALRCL